jgi:hypothetical protein
MLRKIGSLLRISGSTQSRPHNSLQTQLLRRIHTAPDLAKAGDIKEEARAARTESIFSFLSRKDERLTIVLVAVFEPLPEHDESHVGPYGVEAPLHWDFVVKVTEVIVIVKVDTEMESCTGPGHGDGVSEKGSVEPK